MAKLRCLFAIITIALSILLGWTAADAGDSFRPAEGLRRPVAMELSADESLLFVANRDAGSVTTVGSTKLQVIAETKVGARLTDLTRVGEGHLLASDEAKHELILLSTDGKEIKVEHRLPVSPYPQDIVVTADGERAYVSSLWSRQVSVVDLSDLKKPRVTNTIDLPFAPNKQLLVKDDLSLIVADNFAGRLAIVDCETNKVIAVRKFFAENIRGLAVDPRSGLLAVSHTMLNEYAHTVRNDVHWGVLMSNDLRWLRLDEVLNPKGDFYNNGHMHPLGEPNMGGSDPGELAFFKDGTVVVPISGVNKIAFGMEGDFGMHRMNVGRRPTTAIASNKHRRAFIANTFDDSISVLDMKASEVIDTISLGPKRDLSLAERGELLFHDGKLSHDGWMTCNTCHTRGHTNGGLNDNFSDKSFGAPKLVLSLLGAKDTAPYAWNGGTDSLEQQIRNSNKLTMHGRPMTDKDVTALAAFVNTLQQPPSLDELRGTRDEKLIAHGQKIFHARDCASCHTPPLYTSGDTYDVGIHDKEGNTHFNPPSLRGVGQRGPYFHNASAESLDEVFTKVGHQLDGKPLTDEEREALIAFLRSL